MRSRHRGVVVAVIAILSFAVGLMAPQIVRSQEKEKKSGQPLMEEMMAAWAKYGTPGKEHEVFKSLEGKFNADVSMQMPGAPAPEKSTGTVENELLYDGRYLMQTYKGTMMGKPFKGGGLWGFDKTKSKYVNVWIDDMSTMVMISEGSADGSDAKTVTTTTDCMDPISGKPKKIRAVLKVQDMDHHTYECFERGEDGKETQTLTIAYTRAQGG
jgi:hypothetical protein